MITKYDNYIKEGNGTKSFKSDIKSFLKRTVSEYINIYTSNQIEYLDEFDYDIEGDDVIYIFYSDYSGEPDLILYHNPETKKYEFFNIYWIDIIYKNNNTIEKKIYIKEFDTIEELKNYAKNFFDTYYDKLDIYKITQKTEIPVFNIDKYSDFKFDLITKRPTDFLEDIDDYRLNTKTKKKLQDIQHIIDANNFDLI